MSDDDYPANTVSLILEIKDDGHVQVTLIGSVGEGMDEEDSDYYMNMMSGLQESLPLLADHFAEVGSKTRELEFMQEQEEGDICFEPDDELLEAIEDKKIIEFKKRMN
tara:strand:+ start:169 stop:492 length:324 start_codon:yes stop_codon:yes gene_type:complete